MLSGIKRIFSGAERQARPGPDILLTGVPRSGTTLACRLLGECPGVIALNEPMAADLFADRASALAAVDQCFREFRASLEFQGRAPARTAEGRITDNAYSEGDRERKLIVRRTTLTFDPKPEPGFTLILKHNAEFTLLFPEITRHHPCFAIIRNPLAVLASWASVDIAASRGRISKADRLLPALHLELEGIPGLLDKQLRILAWYFHQFRLLPPDQVLRYEDIVASQGALLEKITGAPVPGHWQLAGRNRNPLYDPAAIRAAAQLLLEGNGPWWEHYSREDVHLLMEEMLAT